MKILFVFNNSKWKSQQSKVLEVAKWFAQGVQTSGFSYQSIDTNFDNIPFSKYDNGEGTPNVLGVDRAWYDKNITPLGIGFDIVLFVLPRSQWQEPNRARGWRTDYDQGPVELQIACDEDELSKAGGWSQFSRKQSAFFLLATHEILHALFMISGQADVTHYWWDRGQLEKARDSVRIPKNYSLPGLIRSLNYLQALLKTLTMTKETPSDKIYNRAVAMIGTDASPSDIAPDELGCAESVSTILNGLYPDFPIITGTATLYETISKRKDFVRLTKPERGCLIIYPTGYGNGGLKNGHIFIYGDDNHLYSNNSNSKPKGLWDDHWTLAEARTYYQGKGGYPEILLKKVA